MLRLQRIAPVLILLVLSALMLVPSQVSAQKILLQADTLSSEFPLEASKYYVRAARLQPWRSGLWELAGLAAFDGGDYNTAIQLLTRAQQKHDLTSNSWDKLALSYWYLDQRQEALEIWERTLETLGPNGMIYLRLAMAAYVEGELQTEQQALEHALAYVENPSAHYRLGLLLTISEPERAIEHFRTAARLDPTYISAADSMRAALNLSSIQADPSRAMIVRGNALGMVNQWDLALIVFTQAVQANPKDAEAWAWLGLAKQANGQDGLWEIGRALDLSPKSADIHAQSGLYFQRAGHWEQAEAAYLEAVRLEPTDPSWQAALGDVTAELGDLPKALNYFKTATDLAPDDAGYWYLLASFCARNQIYLETEGLRAAVKARDLAPKDPAMLDVVGWVFLEMTNLEMAQDYFNQALDIDPEFALAWLHLGLAHLEQGESKLAYATLQQAARDDGTVGADARRILSEVFP